MAKIGKISKVLMTACFICLLSAGCGKKNVAQDNAALPANDEPAAVEPVLTPAEQEAAYEAGIKAGLKPFWQQQDVTGIKDKVLELRAPVKYLDFHLKLVIALENLEQGRAAGDAAKIESAVDQLNALKGKYPWIAP